MNILQQLQILEQQGWKLVDAPRFSEKIGQGADAYYSYDIPSGDQLDLCYFEKEQQLRFRIYGKAQRDKSWFGIDIDERLPALLSKIMAMQDQIAYSNYFAFYFGIQNTSEPAILAWEQWEPNYR